MKEEEVSSDRHKERMPEQHNTPKFMTELDQSEQLLSSGQQHSSCDGQEIQSFEDQEQLSISQKITAKKVNVDYAEVLAQGRQVYIDELCLREDKN